jgi:5'-deoxynucleotidase YfbR-like HD superfamily hydrolase
MGEKYQALYEELEAKQTPEAKFAHAIDKLDALLQCTYVSAEALEKMKQTKSLYPVELLR